MIALLQSYVSRLTLTGLAIKSEMCYIQQSAIQLMILMTALFEIFSIANGHVAYRCLINPNSWICHQDYARLLEYKNDLKSAAFHSKKAFEINLSDHSSLRSNYSNNFALSPTRTIISVSGTVNKDPISLSSMYSYDNEFTTSPPSGNVGRNDSTAPTSTNTNNSHMLNWNGSDNNGGFR